MKPETFEQDIAAIGKSSFDSEEARSKAYLAARALTARLESPQEAYWRRGWQEPMTAVVLKAALDMGIFSVLAGKGSDSFTTKEVAEAVQRESSTPLIDRMLKHFAAMHIINEVGPDTYQTTDISESLAIPEIEAGNRWIYSVLLPYVYPLPAYLRNNGYKAPSGANDCAVTQLHGKEKTLFNCLAENEVAQQDFSTVMRGYSMNRPSLIDMYPYEKLYEGYDGGVLLVDVGGGSGHDIRKYLATHPEQTGNFILQDLESVTSNLPADFPSSIKVMTHDFFKPQPVIGAKAYFLHMIMHDWNSDVCREILQQIKPAMKANYSKLLICDTVMPKEGVHPQSTALDLVVMSCLGATERTEPEWHELIDSAGFRIVNIWRSHRILDSILECELKD